MRRACRATSRLRTGSSPGGATFSTIRSPSIGPPVTSPVNVRLDAPPVSGCTSEIEHPGAQVCAAAVARAREFVEIEFVGHRASLLSEAEPGHSVDRGCTAHRAGCGVSAVRREGSSSAMSPVAVPSLRHSSPEELDHPPGDDGARASATTTPTARKIADTATLERIRGIVIPPAWTDVRISDRPRLASPGSRPRPARAGCSTSTTPTGPRSATG